MHAVTNGPDALEGEDLEEFERILSGMISSLFGLPSEFISSKTTKISSQTVNVDMMHLRLELKYSPFGKGKVKLSIPEKRMRRHNATLWNCLWVTRF